MVRAVAKLSGDGMTDLVGQYAAKAFRHVISHLPQPYDEETLERFATEAQPNADS
jgi:hypothetical protein